MNPNGLQRFDPEDRPHLQKVRSDLYRDGFYGFIIGGAVGEIALRATLRYDTAKSYYDKATAYKTLEGRKKKLGVNHLPEQSLGNTSKHYITSNGHQISRSVAVSNRRAALLLGFASFGAFLGSYGRGRQEVWRLYDTFRNGDSRKHIVETHLIEKYDLNRKKPEF